MKILDKKIKLPGIFHEFHGVETTYFDLIITYLASSIITSVIMLHDPLKPDNSVKLVLLAILSLDIVGGVISNFTKSTSLHYSRSNKKRLLFISIHFLQPIGLIWIFYESAVTIIIIASLTLICSLVINSILDLNRKITYSVFLTIVVITCTILSPISNDVLKLLLVLFNIKLILAFPVNWFQNNQI